MLIAIMEAMMCVLEVVGNQLWRKESEKKRASRFFTRLERADKSTLLIGLTYTCLLSSFDWW